MARQVVRGRERIYLWFWVPLLLLLTGTLAVDPPSVFPLPVGWHVLILAAAVLGGLVAVMLLGGCARPVR